MNDLTVQDRQSAPPNAQRSDGKHAAWIAGRVQVLLSHYFQPDNPAEVQEAALDDWVAALIAFPRQAIEHACGAYLRDQPRRRPTPGDIRAKAQAFKLPGSQQTTGRGDKLKLSHDELRILEDQILPTARRWVRQFPSLADQGQATLDYWGERV